MIKVNIRHSLINTCFLEIRFAPEFTIDEVKDRIYKMTGTSPEHQELTLQRGDTVIALTPDRATLADFAVSNGQQINVTDRNPNALFAGAYQKAAAEYKPRVVDENKYKSTPGTVYDQIQKKLMYDPAFRAYYDNAMQKKRERTALEVAKAATVTIGSRCELQGRRRGEIKFIGEKLGKAAGIVLGIELDEPLGDCDGDDEFQCPKGHGIFINIMDVEIGDFPPLSLSDIEDSDEL